MNELKSQEQVRRSLVMQLTARPTPILSWASQMSREKVFISLVKFNSWCQFLIVHVLIVLDQLLTTVTIKFCWAVCWLLSINFPFFLRELPYLQTCRNQLSVTMCSDWEMALLIASYHTEMTHGSLLLQTQTPLLSTLIHDRLGICIFYVLGHCYMTPSYTSMKIYCPKLYKYKVKPQNFIPVNFFMVTPTALLECSKLQFDCVDATVTLPTWVAAVTYILYV